jgi:hypothetical protein
MNVQICPWCQSEILQEEGQEPEKICPVCDNEIDGYRTLKLNLGDSEDDEDEDYEDDDGEEANPQVVAIDEDLSWSDDGSLDEEGELNDELMQFDENVEQLLNEQDLVPECPMCQEYMIEAGQLTIGQAQFNPRESEVLGGSLIQAPFALTMYMCPSCFMTHSFLGDANRHELVRRLSQDPSSSGKGKQA